ncbi:hypothetical protein KAFR_0A00830 [Kazachstania africana CBS 2517]|uniref:Vacuolar protein sorting-associated protein 26 n=1 Tax=Kazachstania africana (strain ATCC 22294 / BCRC 22015 / CBS 2517 / CECT 1963 / NBRC 1671 / NRRL Y-8276) TaxID=1071382 RepID=H2AMC1_KAZAF|nr:hypothetical protein KAFR_0A00830 [Kazachstania africana CBS 2517]CCF55521.1 hypothetical protein KAFR_0A00830 [Kazachstania africana CBS 2517]
MSLFFKSPIDIEILLDGEESRKHVDIPAVKNSDTRTSKDSFPLYEDGESISGIVTLRVKEGKRLEHLGVKVSIIGSIDMAKTNGSTSGTKMSSSSDVRKKAVDQFLCLSYDLCPAGELTHSQNFPFLFKDLAKRYESYRGKNVDVSYYVKVTVMRKTTDISKAKKFWVYLYNDISNSTSEITNDSSGKQKTDLAEVETTEENANKDGAIGDGNNRENVNEQKMVSKSTDEEGTSNISKPVRLDIGIENCLHIEFEYGKAQYNLKEVIVGRIYFLLTRLKIKHMELSIITRESSGLKPSSSLIDSTAIRFEIMDGSPVKGETIPIRLFLGGYDLTPNMSCNYFSVKNYISLVIIDEDGRRYFKQSEVVLYRTR